MKYSTKENYIKIFVRYASVALLSVGSLFCAVLHYVALGKILPYLNPDINPFENSPINGCGMTINKAYRKSYEALIIADSKTTVNIYE